MMIQTIRPYGSINENIISCIIVLPNDEYALVDTAGNQSVISANVFSQLKSKGYPVKTLRKR